jgi:hypothetical protein
LYWHNLKKCSSIVDRIHSEGLVMIDTRMHVYMEFGYGFQKLPSKIN